jgi:DeoR family transcriptional regulator, glycerol-3-phosphate regulon repressor
MQIHHVSVKNYVYFVIFYRIMTKRQQKTQPFRQNGLNTLSRNGKWGIAPLERVSVPLIVQAGAVHDCQGRLGSRSPDSQMMHLSKRQTAIVQEVNVRGSCSISDLANRLSVSEETIRRDVRPIVARGLIVKRHGRVVVPEDRFEPPLQRRMASNMAAKQQIAVATAALIEDGSSLIIDPGSTTNYVARALSELSNLVIVTNSTEIARTFMPNPGMKVYLAGGEIRADDAAAFGPSTLDFLGQFDVDAAILTVGAIHAENGLMDFHLCHAEFSRAVMARAQKTIVVADSSKFGRRGLVRVSGFDAIDILVTNARPPKPFHRMLLDAGVRVVAASDTSPS